MYIYKMQKKRHTLRKRSYLPRDADEFVEIQKRKERQCDAARLVVHMLGGPTKTAKIISQIAGLKMPLRPTSVIAWYKQGVPIKHVPLIAKLTGMEPGEIRLDVWWDEEETDD